MIEPKIKLEISNRTCKIEVEGKPSELVFLFARTFAQHDALTDIMGGALDAVRQMDDEQKKVLTKCTSLDMEDEGKKGN